MKIGVASTDTGDAAASARRLEALGFDYMGCGEHLFADVPTPSSFVQLAAAAGATTSIRLVSTVALLPLYSTALAAKLAASLDQVSGGRFALGVGAGGEYPKEFEAAGVDPATRFRRLEESLKLLRRLFAGEEVSYSGEFDTLSGVRLDPLPVQRPGPPIWLAGRKPAGIRRVGRLADVWMPYMMTPQTFADGLELARTAAADHGRTDGGPGGAVFLWTCVDQDGDWARRTGIETVSRTYQQDFGPLADRYLLLGTPEQALARLREFADAGATTAILQPAAGPDDKDRILRTLAEEVLPAARAL